MKIVYYWHLAQVTVNPGDIKIPKPQPDQGKVAIAFQYFFAIVAALTLMMVVFGGLKYVLSRGEPEAIAKAKGTILYAIIGLIVCLAAFAIVSTVAGRL